MNLSPIYLFHELAFETFNINLCNVRLWTSLWFREMTPYQCYYYHYYYYCCCCYYYCYYYYYYYYYFRTGPSTLQSWRWPLLFLISCAGDSTAGLCTKSKPVVLHILFRNKNNAFLCDGTFCKDCMFHQNFCTIQRDLVDLLLFANLSVTSHHKHWLTIGSLKKRTMLIFNHRFPLSQNKFFFFGS